MTTFGRRVGSSLPIAYVVPRLMRHLMPEGVVRILLRRGWAIRPGAETSYLEWLTSFYLKQLRRAGERIAKKRTLLLGYGGRYDVAIRLLEAGAAHIVLCDQLSEPDHIHNLGLVSSNGKYLTKSGKRVLPRESYMTVAHGDIRKATGIQSVDVVLSNSVFEHVRDVPGVTRALARLTSACGIQIHRIDLRDLYFRYPFEMLRFSAKTWARFLDPTSHHNRYRLWDYRQVFEYCFNYVAIRILDNDMEAFDRIRARIRPEFISGDPAEDTATHILLMARNPALERI